MTIRTDRPLKPNRLVFDVLLAVAVTVSLGTSLILVLGRMLPPWGDLISVVVSIAAGLAILARRHGAKIIPIGAVFLLAMLLILMSIAVAFRLYRGPVEF